MTNTLVSSSSNPCLYGVLKDLKRLRAENQQLKEQLNYFLGNSNIENDSKELYYAKKCFKKVDKQTFEVPDGAFFFTLTFDPDKFGYNNDSEDEENYILIVLHKLFKDKERYNCNGLYLCFEKTKSDVIHAHGISLSSPAYLKVVKHYLKTCFTNNPRNRVAVQYEPAKAKCIEYINKEADYKNIYVCGEIPTFTDFGLD